MIKLRKPEPIPLIFIICATALCMALGMWQIERLKWKNALFDQVAFAQAQAVTNDLLAGPELAWRKALITGRFMPEKGLRFIGRASSGYVWQVPFMPHGEKEAVMVVVGWAAADEKPEVDARVQTISGTLRPPHAKRLFSPANQPEKNLWFTEEVEVMEKATGLQLAPLVLDTNGVPRLRNDHLGYAITWFLLAAIGVGMFVLYYREKGI